MRVVVVFVFLLLLFATGGVILLITPSPPGLTGGGGGSYATWEGTVARLRQEYAAMAHGASVSAMSELTG